MGDPKRLRKKYSTPMHPWNTENIKLEKELIKEYGLRIKKEIWKISSTLKKYKDLAKKLIAVKTEQGEKEKRQMLDKLQEWGLIEGGAELDDVLSLEVKDLMERRLQSLVFRKGLARSMEQARQFIVHRHIKVGDKKITFPSTIISREDGGKINFDGHSSLSQEDHPERTPLEKEVKAGAVKEGKKEEVKAEEKPKEEVKEKEVGEKKVEDKPEKVKEEVKAEEKPKEEVKEKEVEEKKEEEVKEEKKEEKTEKEEEIPSAEELVERTKEKFEKQ